MKPRFNIGDYVEVRAVMSVAYESTAKPHAPTRQLQREALRTPSRGWIVGAVRRFEGSIEPAEYGGDEEGHSRPVLVVTGSKLLWRVAQSLTNVPIEATDADVELLDAHIPHSRGLVLSAAARIPCPLRLGTPWGTKGMGGWSPADQRKEMAEHARDAKGRWLRCDGKREAQP